MSAVRLIFALHNHQPVGNFEEVFEAAYRDSYRPFLDLMAQYPELPFSLHISGPLLEWLIDRRPEYVEELGAMVRAERAELLGGAFYEPILTMIPRRDRIAQIRSYSDALRERFGIPVRGAWIAERVWEPQLASDLAEAGIDFTLLDDAHFQKAGLNPEDLVGYYLTENEGRLLKLFPISERMRYLVPWRDPHETYEYLRSLAERRPGAVIVCADDGEKFGGWPKTFEHVYTNGWLKRFCDLLMANRPWLETTHFGRVVDSSVPLGKIYVPDSSYREMTEWSLPTERLARYEAAVERAGEDRELRLQLQPGGSWRNFKVKYPESDEMYARMLELSNRLNALERDGVGIAEELRAARQALHRAQCNCAYWHGSFGGLYLPHLRNAIYEQLISCHEALDRAQGHSGPRVAIETADFNLDARAEARLENEQLVAWVRPASGGHLYELDLRPQRVNLLATIDRRPETYHGKIATATATNEGGRLPDSFDFGIAPEQAEALLVYDRHPRKALVDHILPMEVGLGDLAACRDVERGDFATGAYVSRVIREPKRVALMMERSGLADGHLIHLRKTVTLEAGRPALAVRYELEELPEDRPIHFAVEWNHAAMPGGAEDRYYSDETGTKLGTLDARLDRSDTGGIRLTDEWRDLTVALKWSEPAGLWCLPIATASQHEGGFEAIHQSVAVLPHWIVRAGPERTWSVELLWNFSRLSAPNPRSEGVSASQAGARRPAEHASAFDL